VLLILGVGTLGNAFARLCESRGISYRLLGRKQLDIADEDQVRKAVSELRPWGVVNAAGYVRVDEAEKEPDLCYRENVVGPTNLAKWCEARQVRFLTFSSDLVFDGQAPAPYQESASVSPLSVYGRSKVEAEKLVLALNGSALVVRTSAFFGPWDECNFLKRTLNDLRLKRRVDVAGDLIVSPTYVPDLGNVSLDLLIDGESGKWHLANQGAVSWADFARRGAALAGLDQELVNPRCSDSFGFAAKRPKYSALGSERALLLDPLETALEKYFQQPE
jgi:dTDP-4-dehydrorhamnose reductase